MNKYFVIFAEDGILKHMGRSDGDDIFIPKFKTPKLSKEDKLYFVDAESEDEALSKAGDHWHDEKWGKEAIKVKVERW